MVDDDLLHGLAIGTSIAAHGRCTTLAPRHKLVVEQLGHVDSLRNERRLYQPRARDALKCPRRVDCVLTAAQVAHERGQGRRVAQLAQSPETLANRSPLGDGSKEHRNRRRITADGHGANGPGLSPR
ncbi:MAG: hypothetical protein U5L05_14550 [Rubrivivax sp.]|nr:hypothetical protein [Rubrivivax sp.]